MEVLIKQKEGVIETNFEEVKAYLAEQTEAYASLVFTEETKKDAKDTVAQLRKDQKAIADRLKEVKKEYMAPFEEFNAKAQELLKMYDTPIDAINAQIEAFEEKRKAEKRKQISEIYDEMVPEDEWRVVIPLNRIWNKKWENATASAKSIKEEIMQRKTDAKAAYTTIKAMNSDKEEQALAQYRENYDLTACITFLNEYESYKREIAEKERIKAQQEAEERIRREEREKAEAEMRHQRELEEAEKAKQTELEALEAAKNEEIEQAQAEVVDSFIPEETTAPAEDYSYSIRLNPNEKESLEKFMDSIGIEYELIEF